MHRVLWALAATAVLSLAGCSSYGSGSPSAPTKVMDGVLTNSVGMTLYTFDKDPAGGGKSECNGPCAANWPPLLAATDAKASGDYTIITRADGARQWAYKGKPLYTFARDSAGAAPTGVSDNWPLAKK